MITLTGTLQTIAGGAAVQGSVRLALRGFGGQLPEMPGTALIGEVSPDDIATTTAGTFSTMVYGNDKLFPAGSYYTLTVKNQNGNIVQTTAYRIVGADRTVDVSTLIPFDPTGQLVTPVQPPVLTNQMVPVPWAASIVLNGATGQAFELAPLQANTALSFAGGVPGNLYTIVTQQPAGTTYLVAYNTNIIHGGAMPSPLPSGRLVQTFICRSDGSLDSIGGGAYL